MKKLKTGKGRYALITGASSGIGYEFARLLAADSWNLILLGRNKSYLEEIGKELSKSSGTDIKVFAADLSLPSASYEVYLRLQENNIAINAIINCAGFTRHGFFADSDLEKQMEMIRVNICSLTSITSLFLRHMIEEKKGWILNVASTAAFRPAPLQAVYYATKAYVLHFSEALSNELKDSGVTVTCLCPGATRTNFFKRAEIDVPESLRSNLMSAKSVAEIGYKAMLQGRPIAVPGIKNKLSVFAMRLLPRSFVVRVMRRIMNTAR